MRWPTWGYITGLGVTQQVRPSTHGFHSEKLWMRHWDRICVLRASRKWPVQLRWQYCPGVIPHSCFTSRTVFFFFQTPVIMWKQDSHKKQENVLAENLLERWGPISLEKDFCVLSEHTYGSQCYAISWGYYLWYSVAPEALSWYNAMGMSYSNFLPPQAHTLNLMSGQTKFMNWVAPWSGLDTGTPDPSFRQC